MSAGLGQAGARAAPGPAIPALAAALAAVLALLCAAGCGREPAADSPIGAAPAPTATVQTTALQWGSLPRTVEAYGVVQAEPGARDSIVAPLDAQVGRIYVRGGQAVAAGAALVQLLPSPSARTRYAQAVTQLAVAADSARRTRQLLSQFLATRQQLAEAEKAESDARTALDALRAQGAGGPHTLRAPFAAIVTGVTATVRSLVSEGAPLLDLARPGGLVLSAGVPPEAAGGVTAGDTVTLVPLGEHVSYAGTVLERGAAVQADTGLVPVTIRLPPGRFMPGQSAQATITVGSVSGYVVPHAAVLIDDDGNSYVVQAVGDAARVVDVQVLGRQDSRDVISGPLDAHAPLVLGGNYQAQDGMKLHVVPGPAVPAAAPERGAGR